MPLNSTRGAASAKAFGLTSAIKLAAWVSAPAVSGLSFNSYITAGGESSAIAAGGFNGPANTTSSQAAKFNGTSWSSIPNMPYDTFQHGVSGDGSDAIAYGGAVRPPEALQTAAAEWNGTSWGGGGSTSMTARILGCRNGSGSSDNFTAGGNPSAGGGNSTTDCMKYNGSAWSSAPAYPNSFRLGGLSGSSSNATVFGGDNASGGYYSSSFSFNGSAFSSIPNMNVARTVGNGFGPTTNCMAVGGYDGVSNVATVENYNGSTWATATSIPSAGSYITAADTSKGSFTTGGAYLITDNLTNPTYFWKK
jgi:hypothetical protein